MIPRQLYNDWVWVMLECKKEPYYEGKLNGNHKLHKIHLNSEFCRKPFLSSSSVPESETEASWKLFWI